jgi:hypothetical protein
MGAAGDMLTGALLDLLDAKEQAKFLEEINAALAGKALVSAEPDEKCGVKGLHVRVSIHGEEEGHEHHHHRDAEHGSVPENQGVVGGQAEIADLDGVFRGKGAHCSDLALESGVL